MSTNLRKTSFLDDFELPIVSHETVKKQLLKAGKTRATKKSDSFGNLPIEQRLAIISKEVFKVLGRYKGFVQTIRSTHEFDRYIDKVIEKGVISFDTETNNSLDPLTCKIMGLCCYIPNTKPVYIPINHCKPKTEELIEGQISEEYIKRGLERLKENNVNIICHNGKFDIRVCYNTMGIRLPIWWDTMIASQLLNENELAKLKYQYKAHVDPTVDTYNIEKLFKGLPYAWVAPDVFALYAAIDAYDTYKLYEYQQSVFEKEGMENLFKLFKEIEMPVVSITAEMEDTGICIDTDFLQKLSDKYNNKLQECTEALNNILKTHNKLIKYYQEQGKIDNPINYDSPAQLQIILYDVLKVPVRENRSTGKDALKAIKIPFTETLLEYRRCSKLYTAFVEPLLNYISEKDGKLHAKFNQLGVEDKNVRTGRFSSTDPNLQQIPSHGDTMRLVFKASDGYVLCGGDFSQQEPRLLASISGDANLIANYNDGKDLYATVGSKMFNKTYWECMEYWEDGSPNPQGKELRSRCKQLILAIMYGMGVKTLSENIGISVEEGKDILEKFYKMFPSVMEFTKQSEELAKKRGYVEDYYGRRRHLPNASLPEIEIKAKKSVITDCDVFINCSLADSKVEIVDEERLKSIMPMWEDACNQKYWVKKDIMEQMKQQGIEFKNNYDFISKALIQCVNARIQGSAATLTKKAMVLIHNDKKLKELGFRTLVPVHDEILGECPTENVEQVKQRLAEVMIEAGKPECSVPMKVDTYAVKHWGIDDISNMIRNIYVKSIENGKSAEQAFESLCNEFPELLASTIRQMCEGTFDVLSETI